MDATVTVTPEEAAVEAQRIEAQIRTANDLIAEIMTSANVVREEEAPKISPVTDTGINGRWEESIIAFYNDCINAKGTDAKLLSKEFFSAIYKRKFMESNGEQGFLPTNETIFILMLVVLIYVNSVYIVDSGLYFYGANPSPKTRPDENLIHRIRDAINPLHTIAIDLSNYIKRKTAIQAEEQPVTVSKQTKEIFDALSNL